MKDNIDLNSCQLANLSTLKINKELKCKE